MWVATVACLLLALVWLINTQWTASFASGKAEVALCWSGILVTQRDRGVAADQDRWVVQPRMEQMGEHPWIERCTIGVLERVSTSGEVTIVNKRCTFIPLWIPFVAFAVPPFVLWHQQYHPPLGRCRACGHELSGNKTGVCAECGQPI